MIVKRSLVLNGHKTSISLEDAFWNGFRAIAERRGLTRAALAAEIDEHRTGTNLSSAIRLYVLADAQDQAVNARADAATIAQAAIAPARPNGTPAP